MSVSGSRAARQITDPLTIDLGRTARLDRLCAELSSGSVERILGAIHANYGISPILYSQIKEEFARLSESCARSEIDLKGARNQLIVLQMENEAIIRLARDFEIQQVGLEKQIPKLTAEEQKAQVAWQESLAAIRTQNPGKKPKEKAAAQKWTRKQEAFQKIATHLREQEKKAKSCVEDAAQKLHEITCKVDCLKSAFSDAQRKLQVNNLEIELLHGTILHLEEKIKGFLKTIELRTKEFLEKIPTEEGKQMLKD